MYILWLLINVMQIKTNDILYTVNTLTNTKILTTNVLKENKKMIIQISYLKFMS